MHQDGPQPPGSQAEIDGQIMFPTGTLPEDADPPTFTTRELEITRNLVWQTKDMHDRVSRAHLRRALVEQGATFTYKPSHLVCTLPWRSLHRWGLSA